MRRRSVLRKIGAGAGLGALSGTAQADQPEANFTSEERKELVERYSNADVVRRAVKDYAKDVLEALYEREYTSFSDSNGLDLSRYKSKNYLELAPEESTRAFGVSSYNKGGTLTAHIMISQYNKGYNYGIYIQPELNRAYAIVSAREEGDKVLVDPAASYQTTDDPNCPDCDESVLCEEEYRCGDLCQSSCIIGSTSCCDYEAIRDARFYNPIAGHCCCTRTEVVECGTHHNDDWEIVIDCTDCYDFASQAPCCDV